MLHDILKITALSEYHSYKSTYGEKSQISWKWIRKVANPNLKPYFSIFFSSNTYKYLVKNKL